MQLAHSIPGIISHEKAFQDTCLRFPPYSILMSVYVKEKAEYIRIAIDSILNQTVKPTEFVLVKDGPLTEELEKIIEDFVLANKKLFKIVTLEKNVGLGLALQKGILECSNELIARMDSDDYSMPNRMEKQLLEFQKDEDLQVCGTHINEFENDMAKIVSVKKAPENCKEIFCLMHRRNPLLHPTLMYKKTAVLSAGNYSHTPLHEDYDLFIRFAKKNIKCYNIQESLYKMRICEVHLRRGGIDYLIKSFKFRMKYLGDFFKFSDFFISMSGIFIICLMPVFLRKKFYFRFLRHKYKKTI
jgi:glycosyltransferase involved in cell wall biosynthesis